MKQIISQFVPLEEIGEVLPFGNGHINDTYAVTDREGTRRWILQRINHHVFPRIEVLQRNVAIVSERMHQRLQEAGERDLERKYLHFYPLLSDSTKNYYYDGENYWRVCRFIPESMSMSELTPGQHATQVRPSDTLRRCSLTSPRERSVRPSLTSTACPSAYVSYAKP